MTNHVLMDGKCRQSMIGILIAIRKNEKLYKQLDNMIKPHDKQKRKSK